MNVQSVQSHFYKRFIVKITWKASTFLVHFPISVNFVMKVYLVVKSCIIMLVLNINIASIKRLNHFYFINRLCDAEIDEILIILIVLTIFNKERNIIII